MPKHPGVERVRCRILARDNEEKKMVFGRSI